MMPSSRKYKKNTNEAPIKTQEDFDMLVAQEIGQYYLSFLGDAPVIKGKIIFTKSQAEKHYFLLLSHAIDMMNNAKTVKDREEASMAAITLKILPFRVH